MAVNVRVELKPYGREAHMHPDDALKVLMTKFRRACSDAGVQHRLRQLESYESKGRKRRRKKREAELALLKAKLRESFARNRGR